jgi:voltage-gated potassium channel
MKSEFKDTREKIFSIVVGREEDEKCLSHKLYTICMTIIIVLSLVPLAFRETSQALEVIDYTCVAIFIFDYVCRWITADIRYGGGVVSIISYPFRPMAIIDLLSILPTFTAMSNAFALCRATRLVKTVRLLKVARVSKEIELFFKVLAAKRVVLLSVLGVAVLYILFTALLMFNIDETFDNFFDAVYWSTTTLTTVGYGDIVPQNTFGRVLTMISSIVGIAIIALPSGIITASYLKALEEMKGQ